MSSNLIGFYNQKHAIIADKIPSSENMCRTVDPNKIQDKVTNDLFSFHFHANKNM